MLGRILLILVLVGLALLVLRWTIWKSNAAQRDSQRRSDGRNGPGPGPGASQPDGKSASATSPLVACEACGLNLPKADAVWKAGRAYCKAEHLPLDR
ncbi:MAG: hypothetical protein FJY38_00020 [Betaproteobacteria bacterium]|jgi:hypothetical protein|nr:hypothetical protein [Betaproteobacteria bacterium]